MSSAYRTVLFVLLLQIAVATQGAYGNGGPPAYAAPGQYQDPPQQEPYQYSTPQRPNQPPQQPQYPQQYQYAPGQQQQGGQQHLQYGRGQQSDGAAGGILSKLKSSLFAAGTALSDSLAIAPLEGISAGQQGQAQGYYGAQYQQPVQQYTGMPPPGAREGQPQQPQPQQQQGGYAYPPPIQQLHQRSAYAGAGYGGREASDSGAGLFGRFKSMLGLDTADGSSSAGVPPHHPMYPRPYSGVGQERESAQLPPHLLDRDGAGYPSPSALSPDRFVGYPPPARPAAPADRRPSSPGDYPDMPAPQMQMQRREGGAPSMRELGLDESEPALPAPYPGSAFPPREGSAGAGPYSGSAYGTTARDVSAGLPPSPYGAPPATRAVTTTEQAEAPPAAVVPPEPQVFVHGDNIVMILRPREFYRKKTAIIASGAQNLQVFTDFERVMTRFKTAQGQRAMGTAELLESSGAVKGSAVQQLNALAEEFDAQMQALDARADNAVPVVQEVGEAVQEVQEGVAAERTAAVEDFARRCQAVIAREGELHAASIAPVVRSWVGRLGLRDGWKEALQSLASRGVPAYLFSTGYGDVVAQVLLQALYGGASAGSNAPTSPPQQLPPLPQNIRIISNFFRTAPDGTVKAFSQPVIHDRNKNATTAAAQMGMPVLNRPHALVLGSHEDDLLMTRGMEGELKERLSVGYLEATEDLPVSLPAFLNAFDAVVLGDGSFAFVHALLDDLLRIPHIPAEATTPSVGTAGVNAGKGGAGGSTGQGLALGLRNRLGLLLNPGGGAATAASAGVGVPPPPPPPQYTPPQYAAPNTAAPQYYAPQRAPQPQQQQQQQQQQQAQQQQKSYMEFTSEY